MTVNQNDLRWQRTARQIKDALITELNRISFNQLTIATLIKTAKISRRAFYLHYQDKYDLLHQLEKQLTNELEVAFQHDHESFIQALGNRRELWQQNYVLFTNVLQLVNQERSLFRALLSVNGDLTFRQTLWQLTAEEITTRIKLYHAEFNDLIPAKYAIVLVTDGLIGLIIAWINNPHPESVANFSKVVTNSQLVAPLDLISPTTK